MRVEINYINKKHTESSCEKEEGPKREKQGKNQTYLTILVLYLYKGIKDYKKVFTIKRMFDLFLYYLERVLQNVLKALKQARYRAWRKTFHIFMEMCISCFFFFSGNVSLQRDSIVPRNILLKNVPVILVKIITQGLCNGMQGIVHHADKDSIPVINFNGKLIPLSPVRFDAYEIV